MGAFSECICLEAMFISPTIEKIGDFAFSYCRNMRIISLPPNMTTQQIGERAFIQNAFIHTAFNRIIENYSICQDGKDSSEEVHQSIIDFCRDGQPPLHKVCLATNVSPQTIHDCITTHGPVTT